MKGTQELSGLFLQLFYNSKIISEKKFVKTGFTIRDYIENELLMPRTEKENIFLGDLLLHSLVLNPQYLSFDLFQIPGPS